MKNLILYTGLITIILMACSPTKDEFVPTLPPITQTGENTFGCYANGVLITPRDGSGTFNVRDPGIDRKSTRLNSSHVRISYAVFCLKKKNTKTFDKHKDINY